MSPLRWLAMIMGMLFGYTLAGPVGGLAGLALGWWLARRGPIRRAAPRPPPPRHQPLGDAYQTLGLTPNASPEAVRSAYRRLLNRTHPDKLAAQGASERELEDAARRTHTIRKAYEAIRQAQRHGS